MPDPWINEEKMVIGHLKVEKTVEIGGTALTATATEINLLHGLTAEAAELNVLDGITAETAELNVLDGITAETAELNVLDGITAETAELNTLTGALADAVITVGAEAGGAIAVGIQLQDASGVDLEHSAGIMAYISDNDDGSSVTATAPTSTAIGTDGLAIPIVTGKTFLLVSEADGDIDLAIGEPSAGTWYLVLVLPNGKLVVSDAITFAGA